MLPHPLLALERHRRAMVAVCAGIVLGSCFSSTRAADPPEGLVAGRWIIAPFLRTEYEADDNIFRSTQPESDRVTTYTAGVLASLPFKMSMLELGYEGSDLNYSDHVFSRSLSHKGSLALEFNFGTQDQLVLRDRLIRSFADVTDIDEGQELVFDGEPYDLNHWEVELTRNVRERPGYLVRITRSDLNFDPEDDDPVPFFDYRGFDNIVEYRHPVSRQTWLTGTYQWRRFNHYAPQGASAQLSECESGVGVVCREEAADQVEIGLRGRVGKDHPYFIRLGYGELGYDFPNGPRPEFSSDFKGLVGQARWRYALGRKTSIEAFARRRPLPSGFDTFYINSEARLTFVRRFLTSYELAVDTRLARNQYGDPIELAGCGINDRGPEFRRDDRRSHFEGRLNWTPYPRVGFSLTARHVRRRSNCDTTEFDATVITTGVTVGWF